MLSLRNLAIFCGQEGRYSTFYPVQVKFLMALLPQRIKVPSKSESKNFLLNTCSIRSNNNQFVVFDRDKWKFKILSLSSLSRISLFTDDDTLSSFFFSPSWRRALTLYKTSINPTISKKDKISLKVKKTLEQCKGPSLKTVTKQPVNCMYYTKTLPRGRSFTMMTRRTAYDLENNNYYYLNAKCGRKFHSSVLSFKATTRSDTSSRGWLNLEGYSIYPWSISGLETSIVVKADQDKKMAVTFDLGYTTRPSVRCQHVFISHGHMDHVSGVFQHATKRNLYNLPPAIYYVPPNLVGALRKVGQLLYSLTETPDILLHLDIRPIEPGDKVLVTPDYEIRPFETFHRVHSQGYLVYRRYRRPKPLYQHLRPKEIERIMNESGEEERAYEITWVPELAYTGDTTFELFLNSPPVDLLKVRVLILEATYLESATPGIMGKARDRGHTHISEIIEHAYMFADVEKLVLVHMSDKYSSGFAREAVSYHMPPELLKKVVIATLAKDKL